jgi:hypothetical protein
LTGLRQYVPGLGIDEPVWVPTVFTKNRDRLLEAEVARKFLAEVLNHRQVRALLSDEHFSVDGTQIAAWVSMKSFQAKDGSSGPPSSGRNGERNFHGEKRSNETHASTTDPEAKLHFLPSTSKCKRCPDCPDRTFLGDRGSLIFAANGAGPRGKKEPHRYTGPERRHVARVT